MRKIVLLCNAGMSTSLLVNKMRDSASEMKYECQIDAYPMATVAEHSDADIILLGPQIRYSLGKMKVALPNMLIDCIEMTSYGSMNGKAVVLQAKTLLGD